MITQDLDLALRYLQQGDLVAFPTETVYGLGADAKDPTAVQKVFLAKDRPSDHPLIVHLGTVNELTEWAIDIPSITWELIERFWPGPLTLILRKQATVSELITGGQDTVALRMPKHPLTQQLLQRFGSALVGPSANKYGHVSPTTAQHVADDFGTIVPCILDGGACQVGIESTIIALSEAQPILLRAGMITAAQVSTVIGQPIATKHTTSDIRTAGMHTAHYAPHTPVQLINSNLIANLQALLAADTTVAILSFQPQPANLRPNTYWQQASIDPTQYAHDLYANLRSLDHLNCDLILIEQVPNLPAWLAINDRLTRASSD